MSPALCLDSQTTSEHLIYNVKLNWRPWYTAVAGKLEALGFFCVISGFIYKPVRGEKKKKVILWVFSSFVKIYP